MYQEEEAADCEKTDGAAEGPIGYRYRTDVGSLGMHQYEVTIIVQSPSFSCTAIGRSGMSAANAHHNAWLRINAPLAGNPKLK